MTEKGKNPPHPSQSAATIQLPHLASLLVVSLGFAVPAFGDAKPGKAGGCWPVSWCGLDGSVSLMGYSVALMQHRVTPFASEIRHPNHIRFGLGRVLSVSIREIRG